MALHFRRSDAADYVHTGDPSVTAGDAEPIAGAWLPAVGQPEDATRVRVRPLDVFEFAQFADAQSAHERIEACWRGVIGIDGAEVKPQDVAPQLASVIVTLVLEITTAPLGRS